MNFSSPALVENRGVQVRPTNSLRLEGVSKSFGPISALRDASFDVAAGSFTAILGPSGCGKTTLLRIVAGFGTPDAGAVHIGTELVAGHSVFLEPEFRNVGIVPQEAALFPHLSVQDNVGFGLPRADRRGERVSELLGLVGLGGLEHRKPHELSGGQQQRVALARCLATKPRIVLLDEPFSALDASLRIELRMETRRLLAEAGTTTVLVTHDQDEALSLADHVALMKNGQIVQFGTPGELYSLPQSAWAASFVGEANLLPVEPQGCTCTSVNSQIGELRVRSDLRQTHSGRGLALLRPEQLELVQTGGLTAKIVDVVFHGRDHLVTVVIAGTGTQLLVRAPAFLSPVRGDTVQVAANSPALLLDE
jgi:iron(III) transport system ATP-binding protein